MQLVLAGCALSSPPELNTGLVICRTLSSPFLHPHPPLMLPQFNQGM